MNRHPLLSFFDRNAAVRDALLVDWARDIVAGARVLDAGAGNCRYATFFEHAEYVPQDHPSVDFAPAGMTVVRSDITEIPLPSASFDAIVCTEVFEHIEMPLRALEEFARLLKPGGKLFLSTPAACRVHRVPTHFYGGFAPDFFEKSLPRHGFVLDSLKPLGNWSEFMAQELGRLPAIARDNLGLPSAIGRAVHAISWPFFRVVVPAVFIGLGKLDRTDDLPLGWVACAHRVKP